MPKPTRGIERRQHPRIENVLPLSISANGYSFVTSTQNVSCTGAYCNIGRYVPPFTKIAVKMSLSVMSQSKKEEYSVECKGVIVRTQDADTGGFNIAIFFNEIKENQRKRITRYINQFLPS